MISTFQKKGLGWGFRGFCLNDLIAGGIHRCFDLGLGCFLWVVENVGQAIEVGNAVDVNDAFFFGEKAGQGVGATAANEAFDFEESFLADNGEAGSGEGLLERCFCHLGWIEFDGDRFWSDFKDLGSVDFVDSGLGLRGDLFFVQSAREKDQLFFGRKASAEAKEDGG